MPLVQKEITKTRALGLWKISESENFFYEQIRTYETIPKAITHATKRLEFVAGRVLVKELLANLGHEFRGVLKNTFGKPSLAALDYELSLSHSYPYVAALLDIKPVGIDVEQPKSKLLRISNRVFHVEELLDAGDNLVKHCIYWCAKEAMVKVHGKKDLIFAENLLIKPFLIQNEGQLFGRIIVNESETELTLQYRLMENLVLVYTL